MHALSKNVGPRNIGNNRSMVLDTRKPNFVSQKWSQFHIWFIRMLDYKMWQVFLHNATTTLLQNATVITKCILYYKMRWYKW